MRSSREIPTYHRSPVGFILAYCALAAEKLSVLAAPGDETREERLASFRGRAVQASGHDHPHVYIERLLDAPAWLTALLFFNAGVILDPRLALALDFEEETGAAFSAAVAVVGDDGVPVEDMWDQMGPQSRVVKLGLLQVTAGENASDPLAARGLLSTWGFCALLGAGSYELTGLPESGDAVDVLEKCSYWRYDVMRAAMRAMYGR